MVSVGAGSLGLFGGRLCLDFVNTANRGGDGIEREFLGDHDDLWAWGRHVGLLAPGHQRTTDTGTMSSCLALRESLHRLLSPDSRCDHAREDIERLNKAMALGARHARLVASEGGVTYDAGARLETWLMGPVAWSASELLTSGQVGNVKTCPGTHCGWLFLDTSRGHTRRWCSMTTCGNRAKARAHYERHLS
ncbi:MAG: CGNR zinc finger domain-containing protein [Pseudomonadota bacterium]